MKYGVISLIACIFTRLRHVKIRMLTREISRHISSASVERSFSQMKMIKTRVRNRLGDTNLSHLMKIVIDEGLEQIIDIWNR